MLLNEARGVSLVPAAGNGRGTSFKSEVCDALDVWAGRPQPVKCKMVKQK
ncbi:hypothetical protein [Paenibacillus apiarius]|nr:hypothetical protein [Paenibacillus apiarius]MBN3523981.1 hypothetical protein [Paenibacillus apiarius]